MENIFASDFKTDSYWWDRSPLIQNNDQALPEEADVVVIGAGYTGLHASIQTARAGMSTVVLDAEAAGFGCSSRNGGQISTSVKPGYQALKQKYGDATARDIFAIGKASLDYVGEFVTRENIECNYEVCGRFHGAHNAKAYSTLARELEQPNPVFDSKAYLVPREEQYSELRTDVYHGGVVFPQYASVDPGRYHRGILQVAQQAGVKVISYCAVQDYKKQAGRFIVTTKRGDILARHIIVATNGYTTGLTPWQQKRLIPIGSYIIATEEIEPEIMNRLMPSSRVITDCRKLVYYYRTSPDRKRILFGGRVSLTETDTRKSAGRLRDELIRLFPELNDVKISHSWAGTVAFTFDKLMHTGVQDGVHYAMGYCGSGVGMASYLGKCVGLTVADKSAPENAFSSIKFPSKPLYNGTPWFLAPSVWLYRMRDRVNW